MWRVVVDLAVDLAAVADDREAENPLVVTHHVIWHRRGLADPAATHSNGHAVVDVFALFPVLGQRDDLEVPAFVIPELGPANLSAVGVHSGFATA